MFFLTYNMVIHLFLTSGRSFTFDSSDGCTFGLPLAYTMSPILYRIRHREINDAPPKVAKSKKRKKYKLNYPA